jgi:hypothetical protein
VNAVRDPSLTKTKVSRSPDLNPVDFFLCGFVRDRVFANGTFVDVVALDNAIS